MAFVSPSPVLTNAITAPKSKLVRSVLRVEEPIAERSPLLTRTHHGTTLTQLAIRPTRQSPTTVRTPTAYPLPTTPPNSTPPRSLPAPAIDPPTSLRLPSRHQRLIPPHFSRSITFIMRRRVARQSHNAEIASQLLAKSVRIGTRTDDRAAMPIRGEALWGREDGGGGRGWASEEECGHCEG